MQKQSITRRSDGKLDVCIRFFIRTRRRWHLRCGPVPGYRNSLIRKSREAHRLGPGHTSASVLMSPVNPTSNPTNAKLTADKSTDPSLQNRYRCHGTSISRLYPSQRHPRCLRLPVALQSRMVALTKLLRTNAA
jgi:hypothetical protein